MVENGILVPQHLEKEYARDHGIEYRTLDNGIVMLGMSRTVSDRAHTSLKFAMPSGAYFDPADKSGLHHFMEHIVTSEMLIRMQSEKVGFNAQTESLIYRLT